MKNKLKVSLLANTGLGNEVFNTLINHPQVVVDSVVTRKFENEYPFFKSKELHEVAISKGVKCFCNIDVNTDYFKYLQEKGIDLIIVATFHQIIHEKIINIPKLGAINFHPSLLPKYRGPSPISWALLNGEKKTGVTIHKLSEGLDTGDIIKQETLRIYEIDNLGTLIKKLSALAGSMTSRVINMFLESNLHSYTQNEIEASYFKRPHKERYFKLNMGFENIFNIIRAFHPFPGAILIDNHNKEFLVEDYSINNFTKLKKVNQRILHFDNNSLILTVKPINNEQPK